jgi:phosphatidylinositol 4-kinase
METRIMNKEDVPLSELRAGLRRAATILCRAANSHYSVVALFVRLPFLAFSKNTIKMGLTLWIGVLKENPKLESRILMEIIENWTISVNHKFGIFSSRLRSVFRAVTKYTY